MYEQYTISLSFLFLGSRFRHSLFFIIMMMMGLKKEKRLLFRLYKYVRFHFNFNLWCFLMDFSAAFPLCHTQFSLFLICWHCVLVCCVWLCLTVRVGVCAFLFTFPFNLAVFFGCFLSVCACVLICLCFCLELSDASVHHLISSVFAFMMNGIWALRALQIRLTNHFMERRENRYYFRE